MDIKVNEKGGKKNNGNTSLYPLKFDDAIKCILAVKPSRITSQSISKNNNCEQNNDK